MSFISSSKASETAMASNISLGHSCLVWRRRTPVSHTAAAHLLAAFHKSVPDRKGGFRRCQLQRPRAESASNPGEERALAPVKVKTPVGKMLDYYLKMEPHLFTTAIDKQLERLKEEREEKDRLAKESPPSSEDKSELVLYRRMSEVRSREERATLEELMYVCILEKFVTLGVPMMPQLETIQDSQPGSIQALTKGIHSKEALEMVKEHVRTLMGQATLAYDSAIVRMPKLQAVQMYVTSIMFGYFLRRVDRRFQLERSAGLITDSSEKEAAVNRLERLFHQANSMDLTDSPDTPDSPSTSSSSNSSSSSGYHSIPGVGLGGAGKSMGRGALRQYVDSFGQETVQEMAQIVSQEAATLIEMQTVALFGNYRALQEQMERAVGSNFISMEDLMERVKKEMESGAVESVTLTVGTQRRAILEAIAFGTFLRDVESSIDSNYGLLTAATGNKNGPEGGAPPGLAGAL